MNCCYCGREKSEIVGSIVNEDKVTKATVIELFYKDSAKRLVCARCVGTYTPVLLCGGDPIVKYTPSTKKYSQNTKAMKDIVIKPIDVDSMTTFSLK